MPALFAMMVVCSAALADSAGLRLNVVHNLKQVISRGDLHHDSVHVMQIGGALGGVHPPLTGHLWAIANVLEIFRRLPLLAAAAAAAAAARPAFCSQLPRAPHTSSDSRTPMYGPVADFNSACVAGVHTPAKPVCGRHAAGTVVF